MKHKFKAILLLCILLFMSVACLDDEALDQIFGREPDLMVTETDEVQESESESGSGSVDSQQKPEATQKSESTPQPEDNPVVPQSSNNANPVTVNQGAHVYSVEATSLLSTCLSDSEVTPNLDFQGNQLTLWGDQVYEKTGENTYKRESMGYYILSFPDEPGRADEKVDRLDTSIITINSNGYVLDTYRGTEMDQSCHYTYTLIK